MKIKIATAAVNQIPLDWAGNQQRILSALSAAEKQNADLLCFPEMAICGYGCEDIYLSNYLYEESLRSLQKIASETNMAFAIGLPLMIEGQRYNAAAFVAGGKIQAFQCKRHLPSEGLHYEPRWFKAWQAGKKTSIKIAGKEIPAGDLLINFCGIRIGFEICEDAWVAGRGETPLAASKPNIVLNLSSSHFAFYKQLDRRNLVLKGSEIFDACYVYANLLGNEAGRIIYDGGCFIAQKGELLMETERFSFQEYLVHSKLIEITTPNGGQKNTELTEITVEATFAKHDNETLAYPLDLPPHVDKNLEFLQAECLALFDYMRKSRSRGFVLSLSGGVDSTACAILIHCMVKLAIQELGIDAFKERLSYFPELENSTNIEEMMAHILLCVYQATKNSGSVTENAAQKITEAVSAQYAFFDVDSLVEGYTKLAESAIGRTLNWQKDDLALQNIQARTRAPGIWMLANIRQALLVTTSNRSEAAVGYATMDGDTCGSICPLGGVDKTFLREWLNFMERRSLNNVGKYSALKWVNEQEPTAELRPKNQEQKDEDDLMPYEILDAIEKAAIRDKLSPNEISVLIKKTFKNFTPDVLDVYVQRFFDLWCRNQWKRERYAPSFHLDDENLDPKTWCRFPILNGGLRL